MHKRWWKYVAIIGGLGTLGLVTAATAVACAASGKDNPNFGYAEEIATTNPKLTAPPGALSGIVPLPNGTFGGPAQDALQEFVMQTLVHIFEGNKNPPFNRVMNTIGGFKYMAVVTSTAHYDSTHGCITGIKIKVGGAISGATITITGVNLTQPATS